MTAKVMEEKIKRIEQELQAIMERNARVEADKAWEGSLFRLLCIAIVTYGVASFLLYIIDAEHFFLGAFVPVAGFVLSVQTLPSLKRWWIERTLRR